MEELGQALVPMQSLDCPAMIMLSGNVVPGLVPRGAAPELHRLARKRPQRWWTASRSTASRCASCWSAFTSKRIRTTILTSAAEAIEIVREVNHPQVQFLYDIYHEQISFGQLIEKAGQAHRRHRPDSHRRRARPP